MSGKKPFRLWGRASSSNVKKVMWLADEMGLAYERIEAGGKFGVVDTPEYKKLNPNSRVPTIEDGEFVLWESNSVMRYLASKYGGEAFYPTDVAARANIDRWLDWQLAMLNPVESPVFMGTIRTPPEKQDKAALAAGMEKLMKQWAIVEAQLKSRPYMAGDFFSLADIALAIFAHRLLHNPFLTVPPLPNISAWHARLRPRPGFKAHVDVPLE
ncbi:MAG TPA: glutathione S-transferase family protein [Xanthobacteraceae bacterium]|nr:glutathione S-transferase family protein [Xanthobacteraceae bacterium]